MEQPKRISTETLDGSKLNLEALYQIAPSCFTEAKGEDGELHRVVDFNKLRLLLGDDAVEDAPEVYDFTWVGKRAALHEAAAPINKTLRPCPEESVDWDTTQNLYIEGDNLEVLKLLQNSYMGKVKMIYIDPPYNTGNDFVYHDDFAQSAEEYDEANRDEEGNRYRRNTDSNGRFHSDWCSMMYARLMIARSLLAEDGSIFISIDDNESHNIRKLCDEIFGTSNFVVEIINITGASQNGEGVKIQKNSESCFVYAKDYNSFLPNKVDKADESLRNLNDSPTAFITRPDMGYTIYYNPITKDLIPKKDYDKEKIITNDEKLVYTDDIELINNGFIPIRPGYRSGQLNRWRWGFETFIERKNEIVVNESRGKYTVCFKQTGYNPPKNIFNYTVGTNDMKNLFDGVRLFDFTKSVNMIEYIVKIATNSNDTILDFFSGSATTAHSVMKLNAEDGGKRKFIMVQLQEETDEKSEAYKAGYKNICEIGKERIRRAGKKIKEASPLTTQDLDVGFRVFKCDDSNYKEVTKAPKDYDQNQLDAFVDNIKEERTDLDLLFDCMLHWGVELSLPLSSSTVDDCTIHNVNDGDLVACFKGSVTEKVIDAIAKMSPVRVVFRDSSFNEAAQKMNLFELFKQKCDWTDEEVRNNVRVI